MCCYNCSVLQELCGVAEDTIIVTSSLTKDMTGREDQYRAPAIRALCRITDVRRGGGGVVCSGRRGGVRGCARGDM